MGQKNQQNNWSSKKLGQKKNLTTYLFIIVAIITIFFFIFIIVINETIFYSIMNDNFKNFCTQIIQTVVDESWLSFMKTVPILLYVGTDDIGPFPKVENQQKLNLWFHAGSLLSQWQCEWHSSTSIFQNDITQFQKW